MLSKKCHKLEKQLNDENEKNNEEENKEIDNQKEILIIDENANKEEENNEENNIKSKLSKPPPILNVDLNSLNVVNYNVKNNLNYDRFNNYYRRYDSSLNYQPRNYTYYFTSHFNSQNNKYNRINKFSEINDYPYLYSSKYKRNNPYLLKNKNIQQPYKLNRTCSYLEYLEYKKSKDNIKSPFIKYLNDKNIITYSYNNKERPFNLRSYSSRGDSKINVQYNKNRCYSAKRNIKRNYYGNEERFTYVINDSQKEYDPIILIENDKNNNSNTIDSILNYKYI